MPRQAFLNIVSYHRKQCMAAIKVKRAEMFQRIAKSFLLAETMLKPESISYGC